MNELSKLLNLTNNEIIKGQIRCACERIDSIKDELIELARYIYENPELGQQEFKAVAKISQFMTKQGFTVQEDVSEGKIPELRTSLRAAYGTYNSDIIYDDTFIEKMDSPIVKADSRIAEDDSYIAGDASYIAEDTSYMGARDFHIETSDSSIAKNRIGQSLAQSRHKPFKMAFLGEYDALPELGHGCGHNLISPMSMGAAIGFAAAVPDSVTTFFGCPAEETIGGKVYMAEAGIFKGYDGALLTHPSDANELGGSSLASHPLEITFLGRAAHIADPQGEGINALACLVDYYGRVASAMKTWGEEALIGTIITEGGVAPNIVPERATLRMTVRAKKVSFLENIVLPELKKRAETCAKDHGAKVLYHHYEPLFKDLVEDLSLQTVARDVMSAMGEEPAILPDDVAEGSTDMGNVSQEIPTIQISLQIGQHLGLHTPEFVAAAGSQKAFEQIIKGAKIMAVTAILYGERLLFDSPIKSM